MNLFGSKPIMEGPQLPLPEENEPPSSSSPSLRLLSREHRKDFCLRTAFLCSSWKQKQKMNLQSDLQQAIWIALKFVDLCALNAKVGASFVFKIIQINALKCLAEMWKKIFEPST